MLDRTGLRRKAEINVRDLDRLLEAAYKQAALMKGKRRTQLAHHLARDRASSVLKRKWNCRCQMCGIEGFTQRNGQRYAETHHVMALGRGGSLESFNVAVVCANCHRQLHFAEVAVNERDNEYDIAVGANYKVAKN